MCVILLKKEGKYCMCSFGYLPGVRLWFADVSEPSVSSIFKSWMWSMKCHFILHIQPLKMERWQTTILTPGRYPKEHIQHSRHGKNLKSRR